MGYRSDVVYMVKFYHETQPEKAFADYIAFQDWVKTKHKLTDPQNTPSQHADMVQDYSDESECMRWSEKETLLLFQADGVKWYDSYVSVIWHNELLEEVKKYSTANWRFIRLGEEYNDVEVEEYAETYFEMWALLDVNRSYSVNLDDCDFDEERKDEPSK